MSEEKAKSRNKIYCYVALAVICVSFWRIIQIMHANRIRPYYTQAPQEEVVSIFIFVWVIAIAHNWAYIFSLTREQLKFDFFNASDIVLFLVWVSILKLVEYLGQDQEWLRNMWFGGLDFLGIGLVLSLLILRILPEILHYREMKQGV